MNKAARNERVKLTATWLNGASVAALAASGGNPLVQGPGIQTASPSRARGSH